jgi:hypothetical protein
VIEIQITEIDGTLKMGQSGSRADRESAAQALTKIGSDAALATAYLTRNCEAQQPMQGLRGEMDAAAKERSKKVEANAPLKWWDIGVGAVLVIVPILTYRFLFSKR